MTLYDMSEGGTPSKLFKHSPDLDFAADTTPKIVTLAAITPWFLFGISPQ